jgi:hypothetical protein
MANTDVELTVNEMAGHAPEKPDMVPLRLTVCGGGGGAGAGGGGAGAGGGAAAALWVMVNNTSPAAMCAVRAAPVFAPTDIPMAPLPFPLPPAMIVNQGASVDAVHVQPASAES